MKLTKRELRHLRENKYPPVGSKTLVTTLRQAIKYQHGLGPTWECQTCMSALKKLEATNT